MKTVFKKNEHFFQKLEKSIFPFFDFLKKQHVIFENGFHYLFLKKILNKKGF